ncbi:hypothetical protein MASR1M8_15850 [Thermomonas brevis]
MGAEIIVPLLLTAASTGLSAYNTSKTAKKQDQAMAQGIRNQAAKQRQADARINEEMQQLAGSTSSEARTKRMAEYTQQLRRGQAGTASGLAQPAFGGEAFVQDAAGALAGIQAGATQNADWMARQDAPIMQRTEEGRRMGRMAEDVDIVARDAKGTSYLDELRMRAIRRNPWLDAAAGVAGGMALSGFSGFGSGGNSFVPVQQGGKAVFGVWGPNSGGWMT